MHNHPKKSGNNYWKLPRHPELPCTGPSVLQHSQISNNLRTGLLVCAPSCAPKNQHLSMHANMLAHPHAWSNQPRACCCTCPASPHHELHLAAHVTTWPVHLAACTSNLCTQRLASPSPAPDTCISLVRI